MATAMMAQGQSTELGLMEKVLVQGDLSRLSPDERTVYYTRVCESLGLNPLTKPFEYLTLDKGLVLYATKSCTDQLREKHGIKVEIVEKKIQDGVFIVTARASTPDGRSDEDIGVVSLEKENGDWKSGANGKRYFQGNGTFKRLTGDHLCNALMKGLTKAKRRVTLSICGLGMLDESEIETIPNAHVHHDEPKTESGSVSTPRLPPPPQEPPPHPAPGVVADLRVMSVKLGKDESKIAAWWSRNRAGVASFSDLTAAEADLLVDRLAKELDARVNKQDDHGDADESDPEPATEDIPF